MNLKDYLVNYWYSRKVVQKYLMDVPYRKKIDDVIDALCLAVIGKQAIENELGTVPDSPCVDSTGLSMQIVYAKV